MRKAAPSPATQDACPPDKICAYCGRSMSYRPRWQASWDTVKFCSQACRKAPKVDVDQALEQAILTLLHARAVAATICPSEAARVVMGASGLEPAAMRRTRYAANRLVAQGKITITQRGRAVDPSTAKGPIRLKLNV